MINRLEAYALNPNSETIIDVCLEYFNKSSSKTLFDLFKSAAAMHAQGRSKVVVKWKYENDDWEMRDAGLEYSRIISIPVEMIEFEA